MFKDNILKFLKLESFIDHISGYVETKMELFKLEIKEELTKLLAKSFLLFLIALLFSLGVFLLSLGLALYLGNKWGQLWGFGTVAGIYLFFGLILLLFRKNISHWLEKNLNEISRQKSE